MREKITFKNSFVFLFTLVLLLWQVPKANAQGNFNGVLQSDPISVCDGSKPLEVDFTVGKAGAFMKVTAKLADGIEYDATGGVSIVSSIPAGAFTIAEEDVSDPANPVFKIAHSDGSPLVLAENVVFTFDRKAGCKAYINGKDSNISNFEFIDEVTVEIDGASKSKSTLVYGVVYPNLILTPPAATNNVSVGDDITRTYKVENGGLTPAKKIFVTVDYGDASYFAAPGAATLEVDAGNGFVALTNPTVNGSKVTYVIEGANLGATNELVNGESITLQEKFKLKTCNPTITYSAGWGCGDEPCQEVEGTSVVTMEAGAPNFNGVTFERSNFTSVCEPFTLKLKYKNTGTAPANVSGKAAAMYNVTPTLLHKGIGFSKNFELHTFSKFKIGGTDVPGHQGDIKYVEVPLKDVFTTDPDGAGVGLDDLDGDGFYDDLPMGATLELEMTVMLKQDATCAQNLEDYDANAALKYNELCGAQSDDPADVKFIEKNYKATANPVHYYRKNLVGAAYAPANVENGVPFDGRISVGYFYLNNAYRTADSRFVYEVEVPAGFTMADIQWHQGLYPENLNSPVAPQSVSQNGTTLTVVSPNERFGYFTFKGTATCANSEPVVKYKLHEIQNYAANPDCKGPGADIVCDELKISVVDCPDPCAAGPSIRIPIVERDDNSLGWTDATMTTKQDRANISTYDLSKMLYKDEFKVEVSAKQNGTATNLGMHLKLAKANDGSGITPLRAEIVVTRNGAEVANATSTKFNNDLSGADQVVDWDFTDQLPAGGLQDGDEVKLTAHYRMDSNKYPTSDINAGKMIYIYNSDAAAGTPVWEGKHIYCRDLTPEIYLVGTRDLIGSNPVYSTACNGKLIAASIARRFNSAGVKYQSEFRPGMKIKKFRFTTRKGKLAVGKVDFGTFDPMSPWIEVPANGITSTDIGDETVYEINIPEENSVFNTTVENTYGITIRIELIPVCATIDNGQAYEAIKYNVDYTDYYYHAATQNPVPPEFEVTKGLERETVFYYSKKPSFGMVNQTSVVELSGQTGEWVVRYNNASQSDAPFNWLAFEDKQDLTITKVTRLSDGTEIAPTAYTGGNMYKLNDAGVASGGNEDYKIEFKYTGCTPLELKAKGGWNCTEYPVNPDEYVCEAKEVTLEAKPLRTLIELQQISVPATNPKPALCTELEYVYGIQSSDAANLYDAIFKVVIPEGLELEGGQIELEYPAGSGSWESFPAPALVNGVYNINAMQHSALAALGYLPGTNESNGDNAKRQVNVKYKLMTSCKFTSGKNFKVRATGNSACGKVSDGADAPYSAPAIEIEGADPPYVIVTDAEWVNGQPGGSGCKEAKKIHVKEVLTAAANVVTPATAKLEITLPAGFEYVPNSYAGVSPDAPDASTLQTSMTPAGDQQIITLKIPEGLGTGTVLEYTFDIKQSDDTLPLCGKQKVEFAASDVIQNLSCNGTPCGDSGVLTGDGELEFTLEKPELTFTAVSATSTHTGAGEDVTVEYKIENASTIDLAAGTVVTLFDDKDNNGVFSTGDVKIGTHVTTADVVKGTPYTGTLTGTGANPADLCNLKISILPQDGCFCSIVPAQVNIATSDKLAGEDITVCEGDTKAIEAATGYTSYEWTSTNANGVSYLSDATVAQPNFTYSGTALAADLEITYKLKATRTGGCLVEDTVKVTVKAKPTVSGPNEVNAGESITLTATGTPATTNPWTVAPADVASITDAGVLTGTKKGTAVVTYTNAAGCTATHTVTVNSVIDAVDDNFTPINGTDGTLNGKKVNPDDVNLTKGTFPTTPSGGITMNDDGTVTVQPNTPAGTYTATYTICEKLNPTNCDTATVTIVVEAPEIDAAYQRYRRWYNF